MMRSLFSAISGLKNHQLMMDVVGNNIANVNTTAFKSSRITFQDIISQTLREAAGPTGNLGGRNPLQVGLGVQTGTIDTLMMQGNLQATNRATDLAIQGEGFFVLSDNGTPAAYMYSRDGNFDLGVAAAGQPRPLIQSATGLRLKGYQPPLAPGTADSATPPTADIMIPATVGGVAVTGFTVDRSGTISLTLADGTTSANCAQIALATFPNSAVLTRIGSNLFATSANSGAAAYNGARANGRGEINAGFLEMSNVDLATQFTNMIIAERGFQANSRVITGTDEMLQDLVNIKR
jgi:flagellar hook protein FlgE